MKMIIDEFLLGEEQLESYIEDYIRSQAVLQYGSLAIYNLSQHILSRHLSSEPLINFQSLYRSWSVNTKSSIELSLIRLEHFYRTGPESVSQNTTSILHVSTVLGDGHKGTARRSVPLR